MTARFKIGLDLITIEDTSKEYGALNQDEVVELLNELHEENQGLKSSNLEYEDALGRLEEENEQLRKKKKCDKQVFTKKQLHERLQQTLKENAHIKQTIKTMMENERTELGQSVLRQLWEAIQ